jgi:hypothetical protein
MFWLMMRQADLLLKDKPSQNETAAKERHRHQPAKTHASGRAAFAGLFIATPEKIASGVANGHVFHFFLFTHHLSASFFSVLSLPILRHLAEQVDLRIGHVAIGRPHIDDGLWIAAPLFS